MRKTFVAFPSITTGAYSYHIEQASLTALKAVKEFLEYVDKLEEVVSVLFSEVDLKVYNLAAAEVLSFQWFSG